MIDPVERIVGFERILEDHLDVAPKGAEPCARQRSDVRAFVEHRAFARLDQAEQQAGERGLAAAAFADQRGDGGRLVGDCERKVIHCGHPRPAHPSAEQLRDSARLEQDGHLIPRLRFPTPVPARSAHTDGRPRDDPARTSLKTGASTSQRRHRMRTARAERAALRAAEQGGRQAGYALKGALAVERRQARDQ